MNLLLLKAIIMDVSTIISLSRKQTSATSGQISDADYLKYLNIIYKDIFSRLAVDSKKYTWNTFTTPVFAWQSEYILPRPDSSSTWLKLVLKVFYNNKDIPIYDTSIYENEKDLTDKNNKPYSILRDWSIFLIPIPDKEWELRIEWKYIPMDLLLTDTAEEIKLDPEYHNILVKWLNSLVFGEKQIFDKQQLREWYYQQWIKQIQVEWSMENESAYHFEDPYLWFLE